MMDKKKEEAFKTFLDGRKHPIDPKPGFSDEVMNKIKEWEKSRLNGPTPAIE